MTKLIGSTLVIMPEDAGKCELCGTVAETRPYGPNGEDICFDCGMKNEEATIRAFNKVLDSVDQVIDGREGGIFIINKE